MGALVLRCPPTLGWGGDATRARGGEEGCGTHLSARVVMVLPAERENHVALRVFLDVEKGVAGGRWRHWLASGPG